MTNLLVVLGFLSLLLIWLGPGLVFLFRPSPDQGREVRCPVTGEGAWITLSSPHDASALSIQRCTLWPARKECDEKCLEENGSVR